MNIQLQIRPYSLPMKSPWPGRFRNAFGQRKGWILALRAGDLLGWGDCAPLPAMGTETHEDAELFLVNRQTRLTPGISDMLEDLATVRNTHPAASHALETALLDILARQQGIPLRQRLTNQAVDRICVNAMAGDVCFQENQNADEQGCQIIKLKMGQHPIEEEIGCLHALCGNLPPGIRLRLDANGAWSHETAEKLLHSLEGLPVESLEEPLASPNLDDLGRLQEQTDIPLALDESLKYLPFDEVLDSRLPRLVIKPALQGGLERGYRMAAMAAGTGKACVVTSLVESAVGIHAAAQLAAAVDSLSPGLAHGLTTSAWLQKDVARPPPVEAGFMHLSNSPGLGIHEIFSSQVHSPVS